MTAALVGIAFLIVWAVATRLMRLNHPIGRDLMDEPPEGYRRGSRV